MHVLAQAHEVLAQRVHALGRGGSVLHAPGVDRGPRETLAEIVVQLAREAPALVFVRSEKAAAEIDRLLLGAPPPRMLQKKRADQRRLEQDDCGTRQDHRPVLLPERRRLEAHLRASREARLRDAPAVELPPVEGEHLHLDHRVRARNAFPLEHAGSDPSRCGADLPRIEERPADDPFAELALEHPEHRRSRSLAHGGERLIALVRHPVRARCEQP
jgi:hypothetical protein